VFCNVDRSEIFNSVDVAIIILISACLHACGKKKLHSANQLLQYHVLSNQPLYVPANDRASDSMFLCIDFVHITNCFYDYEWNIDEHITSLQSSPCNRLFRGRSELWWWYTLANLSIWFDWVFPVIRLCWYLSPTNQQPNNTQKHKIVNHMTKALSSYSLCQGIEALATHQMIRDVFSRRVERKYYNQKRALHYLKRPNAAFTVTPDTCSPDTSCIHLYPLSRLHVSCNGNRIIVTATCIHLYPHIEHCLELVSVDM